MGKAAVNPERRDHIRDRVRAGRDGRRLLGPSERYAAATVTADSSGSISRATVPVGLAPVGPTTLVLVGTKTHATATAPYQMLGLYPNTTPHPYAIQSGHALTYSGSGFAPGEQVLVYFNASGGTPTLAVQADSAGRFHTSFLMPFGLTGRQTLTAIGAQSRASVSTSFTVLPYSPQVQASTYGALPGTSISFYASGFAANEVVQVYVGRGKGGGRPAGHGLPGQRQGRRRGSRQLRHPRQRRTQPLFHPRRSDERRLRRREGERDRGAAAGHPANPAGLRPAAQPGRQADAAAVDVAVLHATAAAPQSSTGEQSAGKR